MTIPARGSVGVGWLVGVTDTGAVVVPARGPGLAADAVTDRLAGRRSGADHRLAPWLRQSLHDLDGLRMAHRDSPGDVFYAAGAPWYFTLFGRDSLWAARLILPLGLASPAGRSARWPGCRARGDVATGRGSRARSRTSCGAATTRSNGMSLPPLYYGTVDATPLWVCLLHDAWRAGLAEAEVVGAAAGAGGALCTGWLTDGDRRRRRLRALRRRRQPRPGQPGLEGQRRRGPVRRRAYRRGRDRAVRGAGLRVRGGRRRARRCWTAFDRPGGDDLRAWAQGLAGTVPGGVLVRRRAASRTRRWRSTAPSAGSTP